MSDAVSGAVEVVAAARRQAAVARAAAENVVASEVDRLCTELRELREALNLKQQDISDAIGVTRSQVANIEAGRGVSVEALVGYAAAVGCTIRLDG